jgi:hypothetical protein
MKLTRKQLRDMIIAEAEALIVDDALFSQRDIPGQQGRNFDYEVSYEGKMARSDLWNIARKAQSLHDLLRDNDDLPEWVQSKIATVEDRMDTVTNYLTYKLKR